MKHQDRACHSAVRCTATLDPSQVACIGHDHEVINRERVVISGRPSISGTALGASGRTQAASSAGRLPGVQSVTRGRVAPSAAPVAAGRTSPAYRVTAVYRPSRHREHCRSAAWVDNRLLARRPELRPEQSVEHRSGSLSGGALAEGGHDRSTATSRERKRVSPPSLRSSGQPMAPKANVSVGAQYEHPAEARPAGRVHHCWALTSSR